MEANPEDLLSDSLEILYGYTPVSHSSAGSLFTFNYRGDLPGPSSSTSSLTPSAHPPSAITLETPDTHPANWALHASSIWVSSLYVASHLQDLRLDWHIGSARPSGDRLRVLELGAGAGLPSILIARCYDNVSVVSSDYPDEGLIRCLARNIKANGAGGKCSAVPYAWGSDPAVLLRVQPGDGLAERAGFDVVVAADTLWSSETHAVFLRTLSSTLRKAESSRIYLVAGLHTGRYTIAAFLKSVEKGGFVIEELLEKEVKGGRSREWAVEREGEDAERERRRWVIWIVLKWDNIEHSMNT